MEAQVNLKKTKVNFESVTLTISPRQAFLLCRLFGNMTAQGFKKAVEKGEGSHVDGYYCLNSDDCPASLLGLVNGSEMGFGDEMYKVLSHALSKAKESGAE